MFKSCGLWKLYDKMNICFFCKVMHMHAVQLKAPDFFCYILIMVFLAVFQLSSCFCSTFAFKWQLVVKAGFYWWFGLVDIVPVSQLLENPVSIQIPNEMSWFLTEQITWLLELNCNWLMNHRELQRIHDGINASFLKLYFRLLWLELTFNRNWKALAHKSRLLFKKLYFKSLKYLHIILSSLATLTTYLYLLKFPYQTKNRVKIKKLYE